jgi:hypothetical protein
MTSLAAENITRPNGQVITNASFDEMNRVLQQNVTQTPDPLAVTKHYCPSGLLNTMTDPRNSTDSYTHARFDGAETERDLSSRLE